MLKKYFNYSNIFLVKYSIKLPKYININNYIIQLKEDK